MDFASFAQNHSHSQNHAAREKLVFPPDPILNVLDGIKVCLARDLSQPGWLFYRGRTVRRKTLVSIKARAELHDDGLNSGKVKQGNGHIIFNCDAIDWAARFAGKDACRIVFMMFREAITDAYLAARGVLAHWLANSGALITALPVPIAVNMRIHDTNGALPNPSEANLHFGLSVRHLVQLI